MEAVNEKVMMEAIEEKEMEVVEGGKAGEDKKVDDQT